MNTSEAEFYRKLRSTFAIEAHEHMRNISLSIIELETTEDSKESKIIVETIHREFHSLKGAARAVDISEIESICHMLESIFSDIKKGIIVISTQMFDIFNRALDVLEEILSLDVGENYDISSLMSELTVIKSNDAIENTNLVEKENVDAYNEAVKSIETEENKEESKNISSNENNEAVKEVEGKTENQEMQQDIKYKDSSLDNIQVKQSFHDNDMEYIRVSKNKLDSLLLQGEEMLYVKLSIKQRETEVKELKNFLENMKQKKNCDELDEMYKKVDSLLTSTMNDGQSIEAMINKFIGDIKDVMLQPFSSIIEIFPKMVRDISRKLNKDIEFTYSGTEFEVDRRILEELKDPLIHIIRNSIDHGIENLEDRKKLNKNVKGSICLNITQVGSTHVQIQIVDDGAGIDIDKLKNKVIVNKICTKSEAEALSDEDAQMLIFKSGMSTKDIITDLSGRGLGLAIVREKIEKLEGSLHVISEKNKGTKFEILLPITISTNRGIIISVSKQNFVIPTSKVEKVINISKEKIKIIENRATVTLGGYIMYIVKLSDILHLKENKETEQEKFISLLIVNELGNKIAFCVDKVVVEQEVLVKQFNKQLSKVRNISGATVLGTGEVVPILDVQDLIKSSLNVASGALSLSKKKEVQIKKSVIVVEDSITSRTLLKNVLENNGYNVKTAVDGVEGLKLIKNEKFDLIISDVEMPRMNGFELTSMVRKDEKTSEIPVILVTSLDSKEDMEKGIDVGASAYIVKSNFQQNNLIEVIKKLI